MISANSPFHISFPHFCVNLRLTAAVVNHDSKCRQEPMYHVFLLLLLLLFFDCSKVVMLNSRVILCLESWETVLGIIFVFVASANRGACVQLKSKMQIVPETYAEGKINTKFGIRWNYYLVMEIS